MTDATAPTDKVDANAPSAVTDDAADTAHDISSSVVDTGKGAGAQTTESKNEEESPSNADNAGKDSGSPSNVAAGKQATTTTSSSATTSSATAGGNVTATSSEMKDSEEDKTNLIINYLPPTMSEGTLATLFSPYGLLERCKIVVDLQTLRSRGYGFVKYDTAQSAERALQALNGYELNGKKLKVAYARKQCKAITNANLYITNIPPHFVDNDLYKLFQDYGKIVECRILKDQNGVSRGVGFVRMDTHHNAIQALQAMDQYVIDDKNPPLLVKLAQRRIPKRYWNQNNRGQGGGGMGMGMGNKRNQQQKGGMGRGNKNMMNKGRKNQYYSPKGRMGMDGGGQGMGGPMGGGQNQGGLGGQNKNSPAKRGYYRAKNQFNKNRGGQNQQQQGQQNAYSQNAARRGGGGQAQGVSSQSGGGAPFYPAPMYDTHHAPYGAQMAAAQYAPAAYPNIPMPATAAAVNPSGGVGPAGAVTTNTTSSSSSPSNRDNQAFAPTAYNVLVYGLPKHFNHDHIIKIYAKFGPVQSVNIRDRVDAFPHRKGPVGIVSYFYFDDAQRAQNETNNLAIIGNCRLETYFHPPVK